VNESARNIKWR